VWAEQFLQLFCAGKVGFKIDLVDWLVFIVLVYFFRLSSISPAQGVFGTSAINLLDIALTWSSVCFILQGWCFVFFQCPLPI